MVVCKWAHVIVLSCQVSKEDHMPPGKTWPARGVGAGRGCHRGDRRHLVVDVLKKQIADGSNKASWRQVSKGHMPRSTVCASLARCSAMQYIAMKDKDIDC